MAQIHIESELLDYKISSLRTILFECEENRTPEFEVTGVGCTSNAMKAVNDYFDTLNVGLTGIITNTIALLENAKDGYINTDEKSATILRELKGELLE